MNITLVGMSNIGKSHLAQRLAYEKPFTVIDCDERIIKRLGILGNTSLTQVAWWLGRPDAPRYTENAQRYMSAEQEVMDELLDGLDPAASRIIDTSGSVIYVSDDTQNALRERSRVIHLEPPSDHTDTMFKSFLSVPKPLIWPDYKAGPMTAFNRKAVKDAYFALMDDRLQKYRQLAHVNVPYEEHRNPAFSVSALRLAL